MPFHKGSYSLHHRQVGASTPIEATTPLTPVGHHLPAKTGGRAVLVWRLTSCCGKRLVEEGGNFTLP